MKHRLQEGAGTGEGGKEGAYDVAHSLADEFAIEIKSLAGLGRDGSGDGCGFDEAEDGEGGGAYSSSRVEGGGTNSRGNEEVSEADIGSISLTISFWKPHFGQVPAQKKLEIRRSRCRSTPRQSAIHNGANMTQAAVISPRAWGEIVSIWEFLGGKAIT